MAQIANCQHSKLKTYGRRNNTNKVYNVTIKIQQNKITKNYDKNMYDYV